MATVLPLSGYGDVPAPHRAHRALRPQGLRGEHGARDDGQDQPAGDGEALQLGDDAGACGRHRGAGDSHEKHVICA